MTFGHLAALFTASALTVGAQSTFYLKDGDRVVFYGDSITDQRLYTTFVETYVVTRFPAETFTFVHSGWGGDRVTGGGGGPIDLRLQRDVFPYKPTVLTIMLGMNDGSYRAFDQSIFDTYAKGYEHIVESLKQQLPGIRITVIEPSPFDDVTRPPTFPGGYNAVLVRYSQFLKQLATKDHLDLADLNTSVVAALGKANASAPSEAGKLIPDRIHPGPAGHILMAEALLKAWNAPAVVSDTKLDASGVTSWNVTEKALPMPIDWKDKSTALAMQSSDFVDALDQENLHISGLKPGNWTLKIDDQPLGNFSSDQLSSGINLARYNTPMMQQALKVHQFTLRRALMHNFRWREIQVPLENETAPGKEAAMKALDDLDAQIAMLQHQAAQPVAHKFELVPAS